jgi:hypothetical protein
MITIIAFAFAFAFGAQATDELGACTADGCVEIGSAECEYLGGYFYGAGLDCGDAGIECERPEETGACGVDEACYDLLAGECEAYGGYFYDAGTDCSDSMI